MDKSWMNKSRISREYFNGSIAWAPNDVYNQVKGLEHSSRVRGLGFGPTPSGRNTKTKIMRLRIRSVEEDPKYQEMKNELDSIKAQVANMAQFLQQNAQHFPQVLILNEL